METSAAAMYIYEVFKVMMFFYKGQSVKQQRHRQKKV